MNLIYNEETGLWEEYQEPYCSLDIPTEEDWKIFEEATKKQQPMKVQEKQVVEDEAFYNLDFLCPACQNAVIGQPYKPNYCKHCGQKLDWSEV